MQRPNPVNKYAIQGTLDLKGLWHTCGQSTLPNPAESRFKSHGATRRWGCRGARFWANDAGCVDPGSAVIRTPAQSRIDSHAAERWLHPAQCGTPSGFSSIVTTRSAATLRNTWRMPLGQRIWISLTAFADPSPKCTRESLAHP